MKKLKFDSEDDLLWYHVNKLRDQFRICCFVEHPTSPVMWAHYAGNHTGVCLDYDLSPEAHSFVHDADHTNHSTVLRRFLPMTYTDSAIQFDSWIEALSGKEAPFIETGWMGKALLLGKRTDWSYEREWRWLIHRRSEMGFSISEGLPYLKLSRIILGLHTPKNAKPIFRFCCVTEKGRPQSQPCDTILKLVSLVLNLAVICRNPSTEPDP